MSTATKTRKTKEPEAESQDLAEEVSKGSFQPSDPTGLNDDMLEYDSLVDPEIVEANYADALLQIAEANTQYLANLAAYRVAKDKANEAKKLADASALDLSELISKLTNSEPMPLFDQAHRNGLPAVPQDDSWRDVPLCDALPSLTTPVLRKLADAELTTLGKLADFTAAERSPGRFNQICDVKGIGKETATKIDAALDAFWASRKPAETDAADEGHGEE